MFFLMEVSSATIQPALYPTAMSGSWNTGLAMPTDNFAIAMHMVLNYFLPKLPIEFEGPR
jgi:hypothetical protein